MVVIVAAVRMVGWSVGIPEKIGGRQRRVRVPLRNPRPGELRALEVAAP